MSSCNNSNESDSKLIEGKIIHSVYFWLNDSDNKEDVKTFETAIKKLMKNSQFANKMHLGKPANTEKREVIDNSYNYCLIFTFDTYKDQRIYQDEPVWWGDVNISFKSSEFDELYKRVIKYLDGKSLYVRDCFACA